MNPTYGFYIRKIRIQGEGKKTVGIDLLPGLNVISGPSDQGKSYLYACINYALGGSDRPEEIEEANGYESILMEIEQHGGGFHTILRSIADDSKRAYISNSTLDEFNLTNARKVYAYHTANKESISSFLLSICAIPEVRLKKSIYNETVLMTFRNIYKILSVDETKIITKQSPVYASQQNTHATSERSLFKYLLTKSDYSGIEIIEKNKIYKDKVAAKIEFIDYLISQTQEQIETLTLNDSPITNTDIEARIIKFTRNLSEKTQLLEDYSATKQNLWESNTKLSSKIIFQDELINRFYLLQNHYHSDLKRLEFLEDGSFLLAQLNSVSCPLCGTKLDETHSDCLTENFDNNMANAIKAEHNKIALKLTDLESTIKETIADRAMTISEVEANNRQAAIIDELILNQVEPDTTLSVQELELALQAKSKYSQVASLTSLASNYSQQRHEQVILLKKGNPKVANTQQEAEPYSIYRGFCDEVKSLLEEWKHPNLTTVEFNTDSSKFDLQISGKERSKSGKGFRAITFSAFIIGLMNYCQKTGSPHPGIVILDSPVTNYQEADKASRTKTQDVPDSIADAFFANLSKTSSNTQIIIIENKQPKEAIKSIINYIDYYNNGPLFPAL